MMRWIGLLSFLPDNLFETSKFMRGDFSFIALPIELGYCWSLFVIIQRRKIGFWILLLFTVLDLIVKGLISNLFPLYVALTPLVIVLILFVLLRLTGDWSYLE